MPLPPSFPHSYYIKAINYTDAATNNVDISTSLANFQFSLWAQGICWWVVCVCTGYSSTTTGNVWSPKLSACLLTTESQNRFFLGPPFHPWIGPSMHYTLLNVNFADCQHTYVYTKCMQMCERIYKRHEGIPVFTPPAQRWSDSCGSIGRALTWVACVTDEHCPLASAVCTTLMLGEASSHHIPAERREVKPKLLHHAWLYLERWSCRTKVGARPVIPKITNLREPSPSEML